MCPSDEWLGEFEGIGEPSFDSDIDSNDGSMDGVVMGFCLDDVAEGVMHAESNFNWLAEDVDLDSCMLDFSSDSENEDPNILDELSNSESDTDCTDIDEIKNITNDPLFHSRQDLFNWGQLNKDSPEENEDHDLPWALDDHPATRNMYLCVFLGTLFNGMTHKAVSLMLNGFFLSFHAAAAAGVELPGVEHFAQTLATVEKCLGVSTEGFIIYLFLCPICW